MSDQWTTRIASWSKDHTLLEQIRREVFIIEQHVPEALEWEDEDYHCIHALALDSKGQAIGTARLLPSGKIGRMAVLKVWRKRGVGAALLTLLLHHARKNNLPTPYLDAQLHAIPFYRKFGFEAQGEVFPDAGIPHRRMYFTT